MTESNKKRRPRLEALWKILRLSPHFLRASLLRRWVQINYNLPIELVFKKAETRPEINQAIKLIQETFTGIGTNQNNDCRLDFLKFLELPSTALIIAKWKDEVIASAALIPDGDYGLPSSPIWKENGLQIKGQRLVEMSNLCVKKEASFTLRGSTLLAFCKTIYKYCTEIIKVDLLLTVTQTEQKAFYTDLLFFNTIKTKEKKLFFGYLPLDQKTHNQFEKTYSQKNISQNLFHYFTKTSTSNIQLSKNRNVLGPNWSTQKLLRRSRSRLEFNTPAVAFIDGSTQAESCKIICVSENGVQIKLDQSHSQNLIGKPILITFEFEKEWITCIASIKWFESQKRLGCMVNEKSYSWSKFIEMAWNNNESIIYKMAS